MARATAGEGSQVAKAAGYEELPEGWTANRIGDLFEAWGGGTPDTSRSDYWGGSIPWISSKDVKAARISQGTEFVTQKAIAEKNLRTCPPGTVLVVMRSGVLAHSLPVAIAEQEVVINQDLKAFRCGELRLNEWLALAFRAKASEILASSRKDGTTVQSVEFPRLKDLKIAFPPLAEQRRIVEKVEALFARVNVACNRLANVPRILGRFRQSVLAAACSGRLTEDWRVELERDDDWPALKLASVAKDFSYGSAAKSSRAGMVPVLRMGNIQDGRLDWSHLVYTSNEPEISKYRLAAGDVLFNRTNSPELVGKAAVFRAEKDAIYAGYLIRIRCADRLLPDYLNYCLNGPAGRDYCQQVKTDGVSQSNINAKKLAAFEFRLPEVDEQREIIRRVEKLLKLADAVEKCLSVASARTEHLQQAILGRAFRGELVPTEAELAHREGREYESASALLARLKAEGMSSPVRVAMVTGQK